MTSPRPVEPRDITRIQWVSDPRISPGGERVAFVVTTLSEERDEYLSAIWMVQVAVRGEQRSTLRAEQDTVAVRGEQRSTLRAEQDTEDGGSPRRFTTGPLRDTSPRWSPDGRWLAFLSERDGKTKPQLHVIPADGGEGRRLTDLPHGVADPVWSPDGTRIAFTARVGGYIEPESEDEKRKSKPARVITELKYKLNGEGFVHDRRRHLFVVPLDGGAPVQITAGDFHHGEPAWSPDGESIVVSAARHEGRDVDDLSDLWLVPAKGGEPRRLTDTAGSANLPAFSPDGTSVAYIGRLGRLNLGGNFGLFTVPVAGGPSRCLTADLDRSLVTGMRVLWPSGDAIVFAAEDRGDQGLWRVARDGSRPAERIVAGERSVTGVSASRDGARLAFTATDATTPAEVFVASADGTGERRLTDLNAGWRAEVDVARPERFRFQRDGFEIDAWVMRPPGFVPGGRYPALVNVHGGPHTQYGHTFFDEFQVEAGAGYVVLFVNPRGSQGYGEAFTRAVVGDWGGGDFADVMAMVDEALRRFDFIDPDRLGLLGGSYGGFLTSWAVGHTDRFRAACSERAVNNQVTMFGTSDIGHWFQVAETGGGLPWENPERWVERSPITHAGRIVTPLLILHSEADLRCPISEAEQLFVALTMLGREVMFVRFPDENHELSRSGKPRHRLERFRFILDWFATYLTPGESPR